MTKIKYMMQEFQIEDPKEIINKIKEIKNDLKKGKVNDLILIRIYLKGNSFIEIGINRNEDSILFYYPNNEEDDRKISFNKNISENNDIFFKTFDYGKFQCQKYNIIVFEDAINELENILVHKVGIGKIKWISY